MAPKHKSSEAGILDMSKRSWKVLPLSEKVHVSEGVGDIIYIRFDTKHDFRHPLGILEYIPWLRGNYCTLWLSEFYPLNKVAWTSKIQSVWFTTNSKIAQTKKIFKYIIISVNTAKTLGKIEHLFLIKRSAKQALKGRSRSDKGHLWKPPR